MSTTLSLALDRATVAARRAPGPRLADVAAVAALAVCALVLHRDGLVGGAAFYELDTQLFYFPLADWVGQQLRQEVFPLWLPGIFTGYPIFADGELGLAYLPQLVLLYLLPTAEAMVWLRVLHAFLAGLFTFVYLRTLRLDSLAALGGALVFAFGSFLSAQMHHENVVRSAVWLPAVLVCVERALRGGFRWPWIGAGALAFAQSALGLHVQPVLMSVLAVGAYAVFRASRLAVVAAVGVVVGGFALAAVQWTPLLEWSLVSSRRGGVSYEFASAFGLAPESLPTLLLPYFFRLTDGATWWSLWQHWETELYVGVPTLALMLVGIVFSRRVEVVYFVGLGLVSLWVAMAHYAPLVNLHLLLWSVPGFSFLRAPGRFTFLVVFACACLAAFGLQALQQRRLRLLLALTGAVPAVATLAALAALLPAWRSFLVEDAARARTVIESTYLAVRAQYPIDPELVRQGLLWSLDFSNPKTAWSLVLLALTGLGFVAWVALGWRRAAIGQAVFVGLIAVDLLVFAGDFHPRGWMPSLAPAAPPGVPAGARVLLRDAVDLPELEPDQLVAANITLAQGYSSLPSQRHVELDVATSAQPALLDLWSAPFVIDATRAGDTREATGVRMRTQHPLFSGVGGAAAAAFRAPTAAAAVSAVRIVGTLSYAFQVPQGQTVATLTVDGATLPIRAGVELSERAYDRPSLRDLVQHQRARAALDFDEATPEGEAYTAHLYSADLGLAAPSAVRSIAIAATRPGVLVEVHGIGLLDSAGAVRSLDLGDRDGFTRLNDQVIENTRALPRAYVLPRSQAFSPERHEGLTATQLVANADMDLHTMLLVENDPAAPGEPNGSKPAVAATDVADVGPNVVRVIATVAEPSYLVLNDFYQRGWTAQVDGQSARVFIGNALFRAVALEPGAHSVEFRYEPQSLWVGGVMSVLALVGVLGLGLVGYAQSRK